MLQKFNYQKHQYSQRLKILKHWNSHYPKLTPSVKNRLLALHELEMEAEVEPHKQPSICTLQHDVLPPYWTRTNQKKKEESKNKNKSTKTHISHKPYQLTRIYIYIYKTRLNSHYVNTISGVISLAVAPGLATTLWSKNLSLHCISGGASFCDCIVTKS